MKLILRIFLFCLASIGFIGNLTGCASGINDCGQYAGTNEYSECLAARGNRDAQYHLGLAAYMQGDVDKAIIWLKKAAAPDTSLDNIYVPAAGSQNYGTVLSFPKADPYPGHKDAQLLLAKIYGSGIGVKKDSVPAETLREAAVKDEKFDLNKMCPSGGTFSSLEAWVESESKSFGIEKGYFTYDELKVFLDQAPSNLEEKNNFLRLSINNARKYFYKADIEQLEMIKTSLEKVVELDDELASLNKFQVIGRSMHSLDRSIELSNHYLDNKFWFDRYAMMAQINYWIWYLTGDMEAIENAQFNIRKFQTQLTFLPKYLIHPLAGKVDDGPRAIRVGQLSYSHSADLLLAEMISAERPRVRDQKYDEFMNTYGSTAEKMEEDYEYFGEYLGKYPEYYSSIKKKRGQNSSFDVSLASELKSMSVLFLENKYRFQQGKIQALSGKAATVEIEYLRKVRSLINSKCTKELWMIFTAWIIELSYESARNAGTELDCNVFREMAYENLEYLNLKQKNAYVERVVLILNRDSESFCRLNK